MQCRGEEYLGKRVITTEQPLRKMDVEVLRLRNVTSCQQAKHANKHWKKQRKDTRCTVHW